MPKNNKIGGQDFSKTVKAIPMIFGKLTPRDILQVLIYPYVSIMYLN